MQLVRILAVIGAIVGGYWTLSSAPASAAALGSGASAQAAVPGAAPEAYMQYRRSRRHYVPYRAYRRVYRPYRYYRPGYYRPRVVCRVRYTPWGPRRVCFRR